MATFVISDDKTRQRVTTRCNCLKGNIAKWGIPIGRPDFEFHTVDIFNSHNYWRKLSEEHKYDVLYRLGRIIAYAISGQMRPRSGIHFALVLIDKDKGGMEGIKRFSKDLREYTRQVEALLPHDVKELFRQLLTDSIRAKGPGMLAGISGLLFGLTTGLIHWKQLEGDAQLVVDKQFLKGTAGWRLLFNMLSMAWPIAKSKLTFPGWSKAGQPDWHFSSGIDDVESYSSYGVQMADFLAYTTMRLSQNNPFDLVNRVAVTRQDFLHPLPGYKGIFIATSSQYQRKRKFKFASR